MNKLLTTICISLVLSACGGGSTDNTKPAPNPASAETDSTPQVPSVNPYEQSTLDYSKLQAEEQVNQTAQISVSPEFAFQTSRSVNLSIDFAEAYERKGTVLVCTDYSAVDNAYKVDYDSCLVRMLVDNGRLEHQLQILNRHTTVLAVMWFAEPGSKPAYQEIVVPTI